MTAPDTEMNPFTPEERWASVKGAISGGSTAGLISFGIVGVRHWLNPVPWPTPTTLFASLVGQTLLVNGAIAVLSGALFALTYRYAIRQNRNPQLQAGVVLAFTLVRGLAQVDAGSAIAQHFWPFLSACLESGLLFGGTALCLTAGFRAGWLAPFGKAS